MGDDGEDIRLRAVADLAQGMAAAPGLPHAAHTAARAARTALDGSFAAVSVWEGEPTGGKLRVLADSGEPAPSGGGDVVAPIVVNDRAWGELRVARGRGAADFEPAEAAFAGVLASVIGAGLAPQQRVEEARRLARTDPLTGLANRRAVDERLADGLSRHRASGAVVSLVICDINGLKQVNDTQGHAAGDRLLKRFGSVLSRWGAQVPGALAARLGGDEFCLLAVGPATDEVTRAAAEICRRADVACGIASTGEPIGPPVTARRLFRLADAAQYRAKSSGSRVPVVAGRGGPGDPVLALAEAPPAPTTPDRRHFRGQPERDDR